MFNTFKKYSKNLKGNEFLFIKYQDKKWKQHVQKYTWFSAVVIQHEMDHLEWILFTDKVIGKIRKIDDKSEY